MKAMPLRNAARDGEVETVKKLIEIGADVNTNKDATPLHWAVRHANIKFAKILLANGADIPSFNYDINVTKAMKVQISDLMKGARTADLFALSDTREKIQEGELRARRR